MWYESWNNACAIGIQEALGRGDKNWADFLRSMLI